MYLATVVALAALTSGGAAPAGLVTNPDTVCPSRNVPLEGRKSPPRFADLHHRQASR